MRQATEDPEEQLRCKNAFERHERKWRALGSLRKRRNKILLPGEGLYFDAVTNDRWVLWRACWDWLRSLEKICEPKPLDLFRLLVVVSGRRHSPYEAITPTAR